jgi:hypothetical protein
MTRAPHLLLIVLVSLAACGSAAKAPAPASPAPPAKTAAPAGTSTSQRLVSEIEAWDKTVVVREATPGHGLGGTEMLVEGTPIWPPQGPGCAELVACCEAFVGDDVAPRAMQLACQLSVAKGPDCPRALDTVQTIVHENGEALPASCGAGT